jgi:hypothetical protein
MFAKDKQFSSFVSSGSMPKKKKWFCNIKPPEGHNLDSHVRLVQTRLGLFPDDIVSLTSVYQNFFISSSLMQRQSKLEWLSMEFVYSQVQQGRMPHFITDYLSKDKLWLTGQNPGQVYKLRSGCVLVIYLSFC